MLLDLPTHPVQFDHDDGGVLHHLAETRARLQQREVLLPARKGLPLHHFLQLGAGRFSQIVASFFQQHQSQLGGLLRRGRERRQGPDAQRLDCLLGALRRQIETMDALDRVAEQVESRRPRFAGREEVEDSAPLRHRAHRRHQIAAPVAAGDQVGQEFLGNDVFADPNVNDRMQESPRFGKAMKQRPGRADHGDP